MPNDIDEDSYDYEFTFLDDMPKGWRKCFGISICKEIKASLKRHNCLKEYRITQIKEKFGGLRWYNAAAPEEVYKSYKSMSI